MSTMSSKNADDHNAGGGRAGRVTAAVYSYGPGTALLHSTHLIPVDLIIFTILPLRKLEA